MLANTNILSRYTFASLHIKNYRYYFVGQAISLSGNWMQQIAMAWLVLQLTRSGTALGLVSAAQFLPILLFGVYGGLIADRYPKRRLLFITQTALSMIALTLGLLIVTHHIQVWHVFVLAICMGFVNLVDNPTRQTFIFEMVGGDHLVNAVALNSTMVNVARIIGPAIGGVLIAGVGLGQCFLLNAVSFGGVLAALALIDDKLLVRERRAHHAKGQIMEGLRYVLRTPLLLYTLIMMSIVGTFVYEFPVSLPLLARFTFHDGAESYAGLTAAMGLGAIVGGLFVSSRKRVTPHLLIVAVLGLGGSMLLGSVAPTLLAEVAVLVLVGAASIAFISLGNTTLQLTAHPEMRGRIMALWGMAFLGTTPIGGPMIGFIGQHAGARWCLAVGGVAAIIAAYIGHRALRKYENRALRSAA